MLWAIDSERCLRVFSCFCLLLPTNIYTYMGNGFGVMKYYLFDCQCVRLKLVTFGSLDRLNGSAWPDPFKRSTATNRRHSNRFPLLVFPAWTCVHQHNVRYAYANQHAFRLARFLRLPFRMIHANGRTHPPPPALVCVFPRMHTGAGASYWPKWLSMFTLIH